MARLKAGTITPFAGIVECPHCGEVVSEPHSGSQYWALDEMTAGQVVECENCGEQFSLPARMKGTALEKHE